MRYTPAGGEINLAAEPTDSGVALTVSQKTNHINLTTLYCSTFSPSPHF